MTNIESFLSVLIGFIVAYRRGKSVSAGALASHLSKIMLDSGPVWRDLGVSKADVASIIDAIRGGKAFRPDGSPTPAYARKLADLYLAMRPGLTNLYRSRDVSNEQEKLLRTAVGLLRYSPDNADKRDAQLDKELHVLPNRAIRVMFTPPKISAPNKALAELKFLVKKFVGRDDTGLSIDESKRIKEKDPERYKRYLKLRGEVTKAYQPAVRDMVRRAGHPVPVRDVATQLASMGFTHHPYDPFVKSRLCVDEDGGLTTEAPYYKKIRVLPTTGSQVRVNAKYDAKRDAAGLNISGPAVYVFQYKVPNSKVDAWKNAYTEDRVNKRRTDRSGNVLKYIPIVPKARPRWVADLMSRDISRAAMGAIVEVLYSQAARVGAPRNKTDGKTTYGISTLLVKHVRLNKNSITMAYEGKKGVLQKHVIPTDTAEGRRIAAVVAYLMKNKKPSDYLWSVGGDRITSAEVNNYVRGKGLPKTFTVHKFRHVRGTELMLKKLEALKIPKGASQPQIIKLVKDQALDVGRLLGHINNDKVTGSTSIKSYIAPQVLIDFFAARGIRPPKWVPTVAGKDED